MKTKRIRILAMVLALQMVSCSLMSCGRKSPKGISDSPSADESSIDPEYLSSLDVSSDEDVSDSSDESGESGISGESGGSNSADPFSPGGKSNQGGSQFTKGGSGTGDSTKPADDLTPPPPPPDQGKGVKVWGSDTDVSLQLGIEAFKAKYPDVPIERQSVPEGEDIVNTLKSAIAAGDGPDAVEMDHVYLTSLGMEGNFHDLSNFGANNVKDKFVPATWDACCDGNRVFGLPFSANVVGNYYNKDLINTYNQGNVPSNFDEMLSLGGKLNSVGKKLYSFPFSGDSGGGGKNWATFNFCFWLWSEGGELLQKNDKGQWVAAFNSQAGVAALRKLKQLKPYMTDSYTDGINDSVAMTNMGSWQIKTTSGDGAKAGVSAMPKTGSAGGFSLLGLYAYGVPIGGNGNKWDAYRFVELLTTDVKCQVRRNTSNPDMPQIPPLLEAQHDSFYSESDTAGSWNVFFEQINHVKYRPAIAGWSDIEGYLADAVSAAVRSNQDEKAMLDKAANKANSKLKAIYKY